MFVKAEGVLAFNSPVMQIAVYSCIIALSWLGVKSDRCRFSYHRRTDESSYLLYEHHDESDDALNGFVMLAMSIASAERICEGF